MVDPNLAAIIAGVLTLATIIVQGFVLVKLREVHKSVNGVTHELIAAKVGQATAEGITQGAAQERNRADPPPTT